MNTFTFKERSFYIFWDVLYIAQLSIQRRTLRPFWMKYWACAWRMKLRKKNWHANESKSLIRFQITTFWATSWELVLILFWLGFFSFWHLFNLFSPSWEGDGWCDDNNNFPGCSYDGGDCCGTNVLTTYCSDCQCLDPNA